MLTVRSVFLVYFSFPWVLPVGFMVGTLLGGGSMRLYFAHRLKRILQRALGRRVPRLVARSQTVSLYVDSILLVMGVLLFFGLLAGNVYFTGTVLNSWTAVFVTTCGLVILSGYITVFIARKRREKALRLQGIGPKEAREGEQGPTER